jgi:hypothetical protein
MKRLIAIAVSSLFVLTGCATGPEFGEVSSAIQDSQEMQSEVEVEASQEASAQVATEEDQEASDDGSSDEVQESETPAATQVIRPDWGDLDPVQTRLIAFEESMAYLQGSKPVADPIDHLFSPNADREVAERTLEKMPQIAGLFAEVHPPEGFTVVWTDDSDAPSAAAFVCEEIGRCDLDPLRDVCSMGVLPGIVFFCYSTSADPNRLLSVMSHDFAHFVQYWVSDQDFIPNWFAEGTATYFEKILEAERFSYDVVTLDNGLIWGVDNLYNSGPPLTFSNPPTKAEVIRAMESSMVYGDLRFESSGLGYYLGVLTTEVMIAKEGFPKFLEFWKLTEGTGFVAAFEEIYGITTGEFFEYFAPYAVARIVSDGKR